LSACTTSSARLGTGKEISVPSVSIPIKWETTAKLQSIPSDKIDWLSGFRDSKLNDLVEQSYKHNPNLKRLRAQLDQASALSKRSRAALLPVVDGFFRGTRTDRFEESDTSLANLSLGLDVSWDADIWGRIQSSKRADEFDLDAAKSDFEAGYQVLAANVVESYFLAIEAKRLAEVSQRNLQALTKTLGFVQVQFDRGLRSGQDISLIKADVASAKVAYNSSKGAERDALRALEVLIGFYPDTQRVTAFNLPEVPILDAIGQPANILTSRPDVQASQARILGAYADYDSAKAAQKPNLTLGGLIEGNSNQLGKTLDPSALASTLFANLTAPVFNGGARKADTAIAKAAIDEAFADYQETVLEALREVELQIDQGQVFEQQEVELNQALANARDALKFTQFRYESAESDLFDVLSAQQRVSLIEAQLVSTKRARLVQYINLSLALGISPNGITNGL